jgi:hypothetical protein
MTTSDAETDVKLNIIIIIIIIIICMRAAFALHDLCSLLVINWFKLR